MGEQVNPFYLLATSRQQMSEGFRLGGGWITNSENSKNCTGGTNGRYTWKGEVPTENVTLGPFISSDGDSGLGWGRPTRKYQRRCR